MVQFTNHSNPSTAIVADDTRAMRVLLSRTLRIERGMEVVTAVDGLSAKLAIERNPPTLLVTDLEMPRMSGDELIEAVRRSDDPQVANTSIIVCSSKIDEIVEAELRCLGADFVLPKPVELATFLDVVATALGEFASK